MKWKLLLYCFVLFAVGVFAEAGGAEKVVRGWPNWMGANHDGISQEKISSKKWPVNGLPIRWTREIGIGFSSISIDAGRLYTMGHVDGKESVYCFNLKNGRTIWEHSYPCKLVDNLHEGGPGSTPTVDGKFVYTVGREGQVFCLDKLNGDVIWAKNLQRELRQEMPEWGFTCSPYILKNQLIFASSKIVSYNKITGEKNWQTSSREAGYGSPIAFAHKGKTLIAALDCEGLRIVRASNGRKVADYDWKSPYRTNSTTPIILGDKIFISAGYNVGCALLQLKEDKLKLVYKNRKLRNHFNNSILQNGYLYGFDGNSNLGRVVSITCMKFETGEVVWKKRGLGCGSLMIVDKKLLMLSEKGELVLAKATEKGYDELNRSRFLKGRCWTVPVVLNGFVYGRNATGRLVCVQLPKR